MSRQESRGQKYPYPRIHTYRAQVRWLAKSMPVFLIGLAILCVLFPSVWRIALLLFLTLEYFRGLRPLASFQVRAYPDHLVIKRKGKKEIVYFHEIVELRTMLYKLMGGKFTIVTADGNLYDFTVLLERSEHILSSVRKSNPKLIADEEYLKIKEALVYFDHNAARYHDAFAKFWYAHIIELFAFPILSLLLVAQIQSKMQHFLKTSWGYFRITFFDWLFPSWLVIWAIFYVVFELIFYREYKKRVSVHPEEEKRRRLTFETRLFWAKFMSSNTVGFVVALLIAQSGINKCFDIRIGHDYPVAQIKEGESLQVDTLFSCIDCSNSLNKNDVVLVEEGWNSASRHKTLATIQALPGDRFFKNKQDQFGRQLAALEYIQQVPAGYVGVHIGKDSRRELLPIHRILGKVKKDSH